MRFAPHAEVQDLLARSWTHGFRQERILVSASLASLLPTEVVARL